jgi:hypothetical protein
MTISLRPPTFIPKMASLKPGTTPDSGKVAGPLSVQEASNTLPLEYNDPTYCTCTVALGPGEAPVPTTRSFPVNTLGGLDPPAAILGSLDMSVAPATAGTLPVTNRVVTVADGADMDVAVEVDAEVDGDEAVVEVLLDEEHPASAIAAVTPAAIEIRTEDIHRNGS